MAANSMTVGDKPKAGKAAKRYMVLSTDRSPYLYRARRLSELTLPFLFRQEGASGSTKESVPWQSLGGWLVAQMAGRGVLTLFPAGVPFFKLKPTQKVKEAWLQLPPDQRGQLKVETAKGLAGVEREYLEEAAVDGDRFKQFDGLLHMIVGGTHGFKFTKTAIVQSFALDTFVNLRDKSGRLLEFVIEDDIAWEVLDDDVRAMCEGAGYKTKDGVAGEEPTCPSVKVYTHGTLNQDTWTVYQEAWGEEVPGSRWQWDEEALPYIFPGVMFLRGEHYARSFCEQYEGDLTSLDGFWQLLSEGAGANALLRWLVKPGGTTNKRDFANMANGDVITGMETDVAAVRSDKGGDLSFVVQLVEKLEARLERSFGSMQSIQRNGERVTATEIERMSQDLEVGNGGFYSNLVSSWQQPWAIKKLSMLQHLDRVTKLPKDTVRVGIITGEAGLGRAQEGMDLDDLLKGAVEACGGNAEAIQPYINFGNYLLRKAASKAIDTDGLIKSDQDVQQEQQQAQQQQLGAQVAPEVVKQAGNMIQQNGSPGAAPTAAPQQPAQAA